MFALVDMDSKDNCKESATPVGSFTLPLPPESKKRKLNENKCIICQSSSRSTPLRKGKPSSIERLLRAAKQRLDEAIYSLEYDVPEKGVYWHSTCYSSYTSEENLRYVAKPNESSIDPKVNSGASPLQDNIQSKRMSRSSTDNVDWEKCLFCKNKAYKKPSELIRVCSFENSETIKSAAER